MLLWSESPTSGGRSARLRPLCSNRASRRPPRSCASFSRRRSRAGGCRNAGRLSTSCRKRASASSTRKSSAPTTRRADTPWWSSPPPRADLQSVLDRSGLDGLERAAGDGLELVEIVVVPARIGVAADVPAAAVVGDDHPVGLQGREDDERLTVESRKAEGRLEA